MSATYIELEDLREAIENLSWHSKNRWGVLVDTGAACEDEAYVKYTDVVKAIKDVAWHKGDSDIKIKSTIRFQIFTGINEVNNVIKSENGDDKFPGLHSADQIICVQPISAHGLTFGYTVFWRVIDEEEIS